MRSTMPSVLSRVLPPAPYVTEQKAGWSARSAGMVFSKSVCSASSVFVGKNSNDTIGRPVMRDAAKMSLMNWITADRLFCRQLRAKFLRFVAIAERLVLCDEILARILQPRHRRIHLLAHNVIAARALRFRFGISILTQQRTSQFDAGDSRVQVIGRQLPDVYGDGFTK